MGMINWIVQKQLKSEAKFLAKEVGKLYQKEKSRNCNMTERQLFLKF